jgi:hypothetical protein
MAVRDFISVNFELVQVDPSLGMLLRTGVGIYVWIAAHKEPAGRHKRHPLWGSLRCNPFRLDLWGPLLPDRAFVARKPDPGSCTQHDKCEAGPEKLAMDPPSHFDIGSSNDDSMKR